MEEHGTELFFGDHTDGLGEVADTVLGDGLLAEGLEDFVGDGVEFVAPHSGEDLGHVGLGECEDFEAEG